LQAKIKTRKVSAMNAALLKGELGEFRFTLEYTPASIKIFGGFGSF